MDACQTWTGISLHQFLQPRLTLLETRHVIRKHWKGIKLINKKLGLRMSGTFLLRNRLQASTTDKTLMKHKSRPSNNTHICQALNWLVAWKKDRSLNQLINYTSSNKVSLVKGSAGCPQSRPATSKPLILLSSF